MATMIPPAIFIIRHGEKPPTVGAEPHGVTFEGVVDDKHSLLVRGWQRAGALCGLFAPHDGNLRPGLLTPDQLIAPKYNKEKGRKPKDERTHETIEPLSKLLGKQPQADYYTKDGATLGRVLAMQASGVTLVCWEHLNIPSIGQAIAKNAPDAWQDDRFDLIWSFTGGPGNWTYTLLPQFLLPGDEDVPPGM